MKEEQTKKIKINEKGVSFTASILSLITIPFWYLSLPLGIYSLVKGIKLAKKTNSKLAKTTFILSLISLTIYAIVYTQAIIILYLRNIY